jgi:lysozyme family protein
MNQDWDKTIEFIMKFEGGWGNDPNDSGGETIFGISRKNWPNWEGWSIVDSLKSGKDFPMNANTYDALIDKAKDFYKVNFWQKCRCDDLPFPFSTMVMDCAVNEGVTEAKRILQMAVGVDVDGVIGLNTLTAAVKASPRRAMLYMAYRLVSYHQIIQNNPKDKVFDLDWCFRVLGLQNLILTGTVIS